MLEGNAGVTFLKFSYLLGTEVSSVYNSIGPHVISALALYYFGVNAPQFMHSAF